MSKLSKQEHTQAYASNKVMFLDLLKKALNKTRIPHSEDSASSEFESTTSDPSPSQVR